jgi:hypothetical protein
MAALSDIHSHGAVQTGASTPNVSWVSATIPIPAALTVPHIPATNPRITTILTYLFPFIPDHHTLTVPGRRPGLYQVDTDEPVI